jgi:hypothetical protein
MFMTLHHDSPLTESVKRGGQARVTNDAREQLSTVPVYAG